MNRRFLGLGLSLVWACLNLTGCELLDQNKRSSSNEAIQEYDHEQEYTESGEKSGAVESAPPKGFFTKSRLSGGLSSEARNVERNLGVP